LFDYQRRMREKKKDVLVTWGKMISKKEKGSVLSLTDKGHTGGEGRKEGVGEIKRGRGGVVKLHPFHQRRKKGHLVHYPRSKRAASLKGEKKKKVKQPKTRKPNLGRNPFGSQNYLVGGGKRVFCNHHRKGGGGKGEEKEEPLLVFGRKKRGWGEQLLEERGGPHKKKKAFP